MIEKSTKKIMRVIFENPSRGFHLRELSRVAKLSMPAVISATNSLSLNRLISKKKEIHITRVKANLEFPRFVQKKRIFNLERIYDSGILEYLSAKYNFPKAIILFGSYSRGEDTEKSDVDIAVITDKSLNLDLSRFEKFLKRRVSLHENRKISKEFKANLANGIVLEGSW